MRSVAVWLCVLAACSPVPFGEMGGEDGDTLEEPLVNVEQGRMVGMTEAHNLVRRPLGIPDLTWSDEMVAVSVEWLEHLEVSEDCRIAHNWGSPWGENLAWATYELTAEGVVDSWASEVEDYDYDSNTCAPDKQCGHYTQIVWEDTEVVGCAMRTCESGREMWMCNYDPPGNFNGNHPY